ncbi:hypothetical protein B0T22DRAFT_313797 [Podospora appendiculata]|uniref:Uncharacterized protein n=1 Tax=Podospora appendiculata TaxID=314037 RepID=A0AAE1C6Y0_9PEZI|nr:hypothetical protein B0T22DRAFT_313797 [Podospora appendiculata]
MMFRWESRVRQIVLYRLRYHICVYYTSSNMTPQLRASCVQSFFLVFPASRCAGFSLLRFFFFSTLCVLSLACLRIPYGVQRLCIAGVIFRSCHAMGFARMASRWRLAWYDMIWHGTWLHNFKVGAWAAFYCMRAHGIPISGIVATSSAKARI